MSNKFSHQYISYQSTNKFSKTALDYISAEEQLSEFYNDTPDLDGIKKAIDRKKKHPVNRELLVTELQKQYSSLILGATVQKNLDLLLDENTFTVCTAHQPNIFTGHLYFIYKIMHAIKMADTLSRELPQYHFVPVFFVGSEDADLDELNHIVIEGKTYTWTTNQKGAVGRMIIDKRFIELIGLIEGRLLTEPFGSEIMELVRECYKNGSTIETATFQFVHALFKDYGLIVLLPDNAAYKKIMQQVFNDDILNHIPSEIVKNTSEKLSAHHHAQAFARDINLFYMKDDIRNRILKVDEYFIVHGTEIRFTKDEMLRELNEHPERFSPNVILRGLFQEMIQPDIAFIGGGGELAYWLQLKYLFEHYKEPYPVIFLRNSFLIIESKWKLLMEKLQLSTTDLFREGDQILKEYVQKESPNSLSLEEEKTALIHIFDQILNKSKAIDETLSDHTEALKTQYLKKLTALEKKLLRAEKKKYDATDRQLKKLFTSLHGEGLQERTENFMLFYALWGKDFFEAVYDSSRVFDPEFCVISEGQVRK